MGREDMRKVEVGQRPRVLVVDDDHAIAELVREILAPNGYAVATARHGAEALDHRPVPT